MVSPSDICLVGIIACESIVERANFVLPLGLLCLVHSILAVGAEQITT